MLGSGTGMAKAGGLGFQGQSGLYIKNPFAKPLFSWYGNVDTVPGTSLCIDTDSDHHGNKPNGLAISNFSIFRKTVALGWPELKL